MKKHLLIHLLAAISVAAPVATYAQVSVKVLETFDYPGGTGTQTRPQKISDTGNIVGVYVDSSGASAGFIRRASGEFAPSIIEPNDGANFTEGRGINNSFLVCGDYLGTDAAFHGFLFLHGKYKEYDVPGSIGTNLLGVNNAGDISGGFTDSSGIGHGFISVGGAVSSITIPGATTAFAYQINSDDAFVGYYVDSSGFTHGYYGDTSGALFFPIDPTGSIGTILFGNNDEGWVVGRYSDSSGVTHGLLFKAPNLYVTYDYPGASFTSLNGINREGVIVGRYTDHSGIDHGFIGRLTRDGTASSSPRTNAPGNAAPAPKLLRPDAPEF